jgi:hypothetical protein
MLKTNPTTGINSIYISINYFNIIDIINMRIKFQTAVTYSYFHLFVIYLGLSAIYNNFLLSENEYKIYAEFCHIFLEKFS